MAADASLKHAPMMLTVIADILRMNVSRTNSGSQVSGRVTKKVPLPSLGIEILVPTEIVGSAVHNDGAVVLYKIGEELALVIYADDMHGMVKVAVLGGTDNIARLQSAFQERTVQSFKAALKLSGKAVVAQYERDYADTEWALSATGQN